MSRYSLFGAIMLWLLFATFLVNAFDEYTGDGSFGVNNPIGEIDTDADTEVGTVKSMALTFINAVSFNIVGLPFIFSLIFFTIPSFMLVYMTLEILIKMLDAIIPF